MTLEEIKETKGWLNKCTSLLLDDKNSNPFPRPPFATNFYNNPPQFCYGRDQYEHEISNEINKSIDSSQPKLLRVIGKQGIGKSTLICWSSKKLSETYPVSVIYLETSAQSEDFNMRSLYRQMIDKLEKTDFVEKLLINSISKFIRIFNEHDSLNKQLSSHFSEKEIESLIINIEIIKEKILTNDFNEILFNLINNNAIALTKLIPFDLNSLLTFWKAHIQNPEALKALTAFKGTKRFEGYAIETDNDASKYIDDLLEMIKWSFDETTTTIIIFDHLEAGISQEKEAVFANLFSLLLNLRQKKYLTIILSGTLDAYFTFDEVLQEDQRLQLDNWSTTIALQTLDPDEVIEIINKYLMNFWDKYQYGPPPNKSLFPFGINSIKYLYENHAQDLRRTLKFLYNLIEKYRKSRKLEYIDNFFKAFKAFRQRNDLLLSYIEKKELRRLIINSQKKNIKRNTIIKNRLGNFISILREYPEYDFLKKVDFTSSGILLEFHTGADKDMTKKVGILINILDNPKSINKEAIIQAHEFFKTNEIDYITWLTNDISNMDIDFTSPKNSNFHVLRKEALDETELAYLSFILFFEEIFKRPPKIEEIEFILNKINLSPIHLKTKLSELPAITRKTVKKEVDEGKPLKHVESFEIGPEEIKKVLEEYLKEKSQNNKQIISSTTIKDIKMILQLNLDDDKWDEDIWAIAMDLSKEMSTKQTPKTIYFG